MGKRRCFLNCSFLFYEWPLKAARYTEHISGTTDYLLDLFAPAKSRQSCPTPCEPIDGSPQGSHPWDSPGKNTGVGCHFLLQCMKVKSESEVTQSCPTLRDPMDCSPPGSSVHGIFQARGLEWVPQLSYFNKGNKHSTYLTAFITLILLIS